MKQTPYIFPAQSAVNLKPHEVLNINPAYVVLTFLKGAMSLDRATSYIWVLTANNHVVLGIERPWDHPSAFVGGSEATLQKIHDAVIKTLELGLQAPTPQYLEEKCGLGHPTLSDPFTTPSGDLVYGRGKIFIAGQLSYDAERDAWILNDKSGRFYKVQGRNVAGIEYLLGMVAKKVSEKTNATVIAQMEEDKLNPEALWKKTNKKNADKSLPWRMFNIIGKVYKHIGTDAEKVARMVSALADELSHIEDRMLSNPLEFDEKQAAVAAIRYFRQLCRQEENPDVWDELNVQIKYMIKSIFRDKGDSKKTPSASKSAVKKECLKEVELLSGNRFAFLAMHSKIRTTTTSVVSNKGKLDLRDQGSSLRLSS